jgi:hypothetical protein
MSEDKCDGSFRSYVYNCPGCDTADIHIESVNYRPVKNCPHCRRTLEKSSCVQVKFRIAKKNFTACFERTTCLRCHRIILSRPIAIADQCGNKTTGWRLCAPKNRICPSVIWAHEEFHRRMKALGKYQVVLNKDIERK